MPNHSYDNKDTCVVCGLTKREAVFFPWMTCDDVIEEHLAELAFEEYAS
jgi:hypothetical protein